MFFESKINRSRLAMNRRFLGTEDGYTLLETVVALALFLSVLIPLGVMIGNMFLDRGSDLLRGSLRACQSEMTRIINQHDYTSGERRIDQDMVIDWKVARTGNLLEIDIRSTACERRILDIHKSILVSK